MNEQIARAEMAVRDAEAKQQRAFKTYDVYTDGHNYITPETAVRYGDDWRAAIAATETAREHLVQLLAQEDRKDRLQKAKVVGLLTLIAGAVIATKIRK